MQILQTNKTETWKSIPGFTGYEVSDQGNVRSYKMRGGVGIYETPHLLKPSPDPKGYLCVHLSQNGITHYSRVAHLIMRTFIGPRPDGMEVCHNNSILDDNRLKNLRYDTHLGNLRDRLDLSDAQVVEMRKQCSQGKSIDSLAKLFDISYGRARKICRGDSYPEIKGPLTTEGRWGKIAPETIIAMRTERAYTNITLKDLGKKYGLSESAISLICRGLRYPNDGGPLTGKTMSV